MSRDQRVEDNHALIAAQKHAIAKKLPLAVVFCLYSSSGYRAKEHYSFMLDGLREVEQKLQTLHIPFMMVFGEAYERILAVAHHTKPDAIYFDFSPLRGPRQLQNKVVDALSCHLFVVDTHNVVPV